MTGCQTCGGYGNHHDLGAHFDNGEEVVVTYVEGGYVGDAPIPDLARCAYQQGDIPPRGPVRVHRGGCMDQRPLVGNDPCRTCGATPELLPTRQEGDR